MASIDPHGTLMGRMRFIDGALTPAGLACEPDHREYAHESSISFGRNMVVGDDDGHRPRRRRPSRDAHRCCFCT